MVDAPKRNQPWTAREHERLLALVDAGHDDRAIGRRLGRSAKAVQQRRWKLFRRGLGPDGLTLAQVAAALGVTRASASRYLRSGCIAGARVGVRRGPERDATSAEWRVQPEAVRAFIATPRLWGRWRPELVTDFYWRAVVEDVAPPRLLSTLEAARRLNYTRRHVLWLVERGRLAAVRAVGPRGGIVFLVHEDALEGVA